VLPILACQSSSGVSQQGQLKLSTRSDGYAYSHTHYLGEDGLVLGTYTLFDEFDTDLGNRAFYFTVTDGLHDLGSLVNGGLSANGWESLAGAGRRNALGQIVGSGKLVSHFGGSMPYLLTPIPEPSTLVLASLAIGGLFLSTRRA
ncbi:MAG: PEP-CTERM sorting domain-containing protein, partial [Pirellulales bacterium]